MIRFSVEVVHGISVLRKFQGNGTSVLIPGRLIRPAGGFSQLLALPCPHGADQTAGLFLILLGGAVRADFPCADVVDLVRFLDVRSVGCGQVIDGPYAVSCPAVPYMCGGSVDIAEEDRRTPRVGALPSASDAQDVDQRVVVPALEPGGALVGSVAHEQPEGVIPRIVDSTTLAYEEFGIPDAAVGGEGRREQHLELCGWHVLVLISPEESGLAVLGENRACGFRQYVQLHVSILSRRVCGEASGVLCLDPLFLLWRDCGAGLILAGAVRSSMLDDCDSSGMEGARFLSRSSRYAVVLAGAVRPYRVRQSLLAGRGAPRFLSPSSRYAVLAYAADHIMVISFPATFVASDRGSGSLTRLLVVAGSRCRLYPCRFRASSPVRRLALVGQGKTRFLPRLSRYVVLAHVAGHMCGRVYSGVIPVVRTRVLATGITVAVYSCLVSMLQAWSCAGLRVIVLPSSPVTSRVWPVVAYRASASCSASGSVSSASGRVCCGSHVMSSMLMVVSFPATFLASDRWNLVGSDYFAVAGSRRRSYPCRRRCVLPVLDDCYSSGTGKTRFLPCSSRYTVLAQATIHACDVCGRGVSDGAEFPLQEQVWVDPHLMHGFLDGCDGHAVRQWFEDVETVPCVHVGDVPPVDGAVGSGCFESEHDHILSRRIATNDGAFIGFGVVMLRAAGLRCGPMLACAVRPFPCPTSSGRRTWGGACFLPRFAWYAVLAWFAGHAYGVWLVSYWFV